MITDGQTLSVSGSVMILVENAGIQSIDSPFDILVFEDSNKNEMFDPDHDFTLGKFENFGALSAGQKVELEIPVKGQLTFAGNLVYAFVDPQNRIIENNEKNNIAHTGLLCGLLPAPDGFKPALQWRWTESKIEPASNQIISTPLVARSHDSNANGRLDRQDLPAVIFVTTTDRTGDAGFARGILRAITGDSGKTIFEVTDPSLRLQAGAQMATADIDGDSLIEIITVAHGGSKLIAFEHDGRFKWFSAPVSVDLGGAAIADLDHDGRPEIVIGATILDHNGQLKARGQEAGTGRNGVSGPLSVVANIDLQGDDEIITGNAVYRSDGSLFWQNRTVGDGFAAVGNLDQDQFPEIVAIRFGMIHALEHTGALKWGPFLIPGGGIGGAPTLADLDGDGSVEIGIAGARNLSILAANGKVKWSIETQDLSSSMTSSTFFDFDGDGVLEVVYNDELHLRILDGGSGAIKFETPNTSGTLLEMPIVADIDNDGAAEIVTIRNQILSLGPLVGLSDQGIFVYESAQKDWLGARSIWNQHSYHVTNVHENGLIPPFEAPYWTSFNLFRANQATSQPRLQALPDLRPSFLRFREADSTLVIRVGNGGSASVPPGTAVKFLLGDTRNTLQILGMRRTSATLLPGQFEDLALRLNAIPFGAQTFSVIADEDTAGAQAVVECNEDNNAYTATLFFPEKFLVRILAPADSAAFFCRDSILVEAEITIQDSSLNVAQLACQINGKNVERRGRAFSTIVPLTSGANTLIALCRDLQDFAASDTAVILNQDDADPPTCSFNTSADFAEGIFQDAGSGLAAIVPVILANARLLVAPFEAGAHTVAFRIDAIQPGKPFGFGIQVIDVCGNALFCDPVIALLTPAHDGAETHIGFFALDRYLTLQNRGLETVRLKLNGVQFQLSTAPTKEQNHFQIPSRGSITLDLVKHLHAGENLLVIACEGPAGSSALLQLADQAAQIDHELNLNILPQAFALLQNFPNPFNPATIIAFDIPAAAPAGVYTDLKIYDNLGKTVRQLVAGIQMPGHYEITWDGLDDHGRRVTSGVYIYRVAAGGWRATRRMLLLQ